MNKMDFSQMLSLQDPAHQNVVAFVVANWQSILVELPAYLEDVMVILAKNKVKIDLDSLEKLLFKLMELLPGNVSVKKYESHSSGYSQTVLEYLDLQPLQPMQESLSFKIDERELPGKQGKNSISELEKLLVEAMDDTSMGRTKEEELKYLLESPTSMDLLAREYALAQEPVPYTGACPLSTKECAKLRTKACHKIHFQSVIRSNTDVSLGDCSYLNTCFKGKNCRYVHYHISLPEAGKNGKSPESHQSPWIGPLLVPGESVGRGKVSLDLRTTVFSKLT